MTGFNSYLPVTHNNLLPGILLDISMSTPPTPPLTQWSLDALFILPYARIRYYRKLYARLLKSTREGRSDHRLLVVANQRLESLVAEVESRLEADVGEDDAPGPSLPNTNGILSREPSWQVNERVSRTSSAMDSSLESHTKWVDPSGLAGLTEISLSPFSSRVEDPRSSSGSAATSHNQSPQKRPTVKVPSMTSSSISPPTTATAPLSDLEMRIDPERALDLFTMFPKVS